MKTSLHENPANNPLFVSVLKKTLKENEAFVREQKFRQGVNTNFMRNIKTGSVFTVTHCHDGYMFNPSERSFRKPFFRKSLEGYELAGTGSE